MKDRRKLGERSVKLDQRSRGTESFELSPSCTFQICTKHCSVEKFNFLHPTTAEIWKVETPLLSSRTKRGTCNAIDLLLPRTFTDDQLLKKLTPIFVEDRSAGWLFHLIGGSEHYFFCAIVLPTLRYELSRGRLIEYHITKRAGVSVSFRPF